MSTATQGSEDTGTPRYSVVIPFYNESENAAALIDEVKAAMAGMGAYELVVVNDGSADSTGQVLRTAAGSSSNIRVFTFARNQGQAAALYFAMKSARGEILITLDGDGQNDPSDIPHMLRRLEEADMVAGRRVNRQDSWSRRRMSRLANGFRSRILGDGVHDTGCALKVFRRAVVESFIPMRTLYSFMPALAVAAGFKVVEEPVAHRPRLRGQSNYNLKVFLWRPILDLLGVLWFSRRRFPAEIPLQDD